MYTEEYEQEIDLKELLFALLYRWRLLLVAAVAGAALLAGYKQMKGGSELSEVGPEESYQEQLEQYETNQMDLEEAIASLENNMAEQNQYLAKAPLMQINPYKEAVASAQFLIDTAADGDQSMGTLLQAYEAALSDDEYLQEVAGKLNTESRYVKELIRVQNRPGLESSDSVAVVLQVQENAVTKGLLQVQAVGVDAEMAEWVLEAVTAQCEEVHAQLNAEVKPHSLKLLNQNTGEQVDMDLVTIQQTVRNNVSSLQRTLTDMKSSLNTLEVPVDTAAGGESVKGIVKYGILGFLAGGFLAVCAVAALYIFSDKVRNEKEVADRFRLKSLGAFAAVPKKRVFGFIDSWLRHLAGDDKTWPDDLVYEMIGTNAANYAEGRKSLFVTGLASEERMQAVCEHIRAALPAVEIAVERDVVNSASARRQMAESEGVILVEERNASRYSVIQQELELAGYVKTEVVGFVVV